eukprot:9485849-Pyramimonas_sp.AAC.1
MPEMTGSRVQVQDGRVLKPRVPHCPPVKELRRIQGFAQGAGTTLHLQASVAASLVDNHAKSCRQGKLVDVCDAAAKAHGPRVPEERRRKPSSRSWEE